MHRHAFRVVAVFCLVVLAWAAPAGARQFSQSSCTCAGTYPPSVRSLDLESEPTAGPPGSVAHVLGHACAGGVVLTVLFDDAALATTTTDASGAVSTSVTIPTGAEAGSHSIRVSGAGCAQAAIFMVERPTVAGVAFTGARNIYGLVEVAAGLALLGAVLVLVARRRRAENRLGEG